jgi:lipopolysaccharide/colanic/teichoic acid biosynthesis glycosyltransferase
VLIADGEYFNEIEKDLLNADSNYKIKYFINTNQDFKKKYTEKQIHVAALKDIAKNDINEIVVTRSSKFSSPTLYNDLLHLFNTGKVVKEYSEVYEELSGKVYISLKNKDLYKQFPFSEHNVKPLFKLVHRMFDIIVSIIGLLVMLLMIPFLVLINFFANKGPLFYKQERVGKKGKLFSIIKLRSMVIDAERNGAVWADKNDSRVTPFGKFLRKTRLDEIPQFFNILKGEMSIIGPRPERSVFVDQLANEIPFYPTRHIIKPGLTGWAQVNTSYGASVDESLLKLQYDLYYIKHRNLFLDFNIIMKTLTTVLFFRGQ